MRCCTAVFRFRHRLLLAVMKAYETETTSLDSPMILEKPFRITALTNVTIELSPKAEKI